MTGSGGQATDGEYVRPLTFRSPPGWPHPADYWIAGHLGWEPTRGWVPIDGLPPAPEGWVFWERTEPGWSAAVRAARHASRIWLTVGAILFVVGATLTGLSVGSPSGGGGIAVIFWGATFWGAAFFARSLVLRRRAATDAIEAIRRDAAVIKDSLDRTAYREFLASRAPS